jgi:hypothetical protein
LREFFTVHQRTSRNAGTLSVTPDQLIEVEVRRVARQEVQGQLALRADDVVLHACRGKIYRLRLVELLEMRVVLVHYHLFKNAGTTMDAILARSFPDLAHGDIEGPEPWCTVTPQQLLTFVHTKVSRCQRSICTGSR